MSGAPDTLFDFHTGRRLQTEFLEAVLAVSREKDVRLGLDDRTHGAPAADPETGEPDVALIEPIELDRWTSIEKRDVMSRFLAMPTAAAAIERIDPTPEPAPAPAAEEQKQLDKVMKFFG